MDADYSDFTQFQDDLTQELESGHFATQPKPEEAQSTSQTLFRLENASVQTDQTQTASQNKLVIKQTKGYNQKMYDALEPKIQQQWDHFETWKATGTFTAEQDLIDQEYVTYGLITKYMGLYGKSKI